MRAISIYLMFCAATSLAKPTSKCAQQYGSLQTARQAWTDRYIKSQSVLAANFFVYPYIWYLRGKGTHNYFTEHGSNFFLGLAWMGTVDGALVRNFKLFQHYPKLATVSSAASYAWLNWYLELGQTFGHNDYRDFWAGIAAIPVFLWHNERARNKLGPRP